MSGSTIGSVVGAGIGFIYGGPAGARWGWVIGGVIGGIVDPQKSYGPRLTDAQRQTSQEGVPIPFGFGSFPCMGNVIWAGELVEHTQKEGGKGGPQTITYTYTRSFAVGFCEGEIASFQQVKINGKLVYDVSTTSTIQSESGKFLENATLYYGSESQGVDPTMEAALGAGEVNPHKGLAYIVFEDFDVTDTQGAIPQIEVVVQECGTLTTTDNSLVGLSNFYYPLQSDYVDVKGTLADLTPNGSVSFGGVGLNILTVGSNANKTGSSTGVDGATHWTISVKARIDDESAGVNKAIAGHYTNTILGYHTWRIFASNMSIVCSVNGLASSGDSIATPFDVDEGQVFVISMRFSPGLLEMFFDGTLVDDLAITPGTLSGSGEFLIGAASMIGSIGHCFGITQAVSDDQIAAIAAEMGTATDLVPIPDSPGVFVDADGDLNASIAEQSEVSDCASSLDEILTELCFRAGIDTATELSTSLPTDVVKGFKCAAQNGSAAEYIEALRLAYFFDRGEWDKQIHFPKRGGASVASLTTDDLIRLDDNQPCIQWTQIQEPELLRKVNVMTIDPDAGYNNGKATWERRAGTINAKGEEAVEVPVVMTAADAAQVAEIRGKLAWAETAKARYGLTVKHSKLVPTDVVSLTDKNGIVHRLRLQDMNEQAGVFEVAEAVKDRQSVYTAAVATGDTNPNTGGSTSPGLVGATDFTAMNLPQLRPQDGQGMYIGAAGRLSGWAGCQILLSVDGGVSYQTMLTVTTPTVLGPLTASCTGSSEPVAVKVYGGDLESKTAAQVEAGGNYSAILSGSTAEVLAYQTATLTATGTATKDYNLSVNTRGLLSTGAVAHAAADTFMDLATCYFIPIDASYAGTVYFKAVSLGISADAVTGVAYTYSPSDAVIDGGEVVGPLGLLDRAGASIKDRYGRALNTRV